VARWNTHRRNGIVVAAAAAAAARQLGGEGQREPWLVRRRAAAPLLSRGSRRGLLIVARGVGAGRRRPRTLVHLQAVVAHLSEEAQQLTVRYEGRTKVIDLADAAVSTTLRVRSTPPIIKRMYEQGDRVEIYSESKQAWMAGMVVAVDGRKIMVQY
jgi:hypothetical protein